jgi:hypothetical protein
MAMMISVASSALVRLAGVFALVAGLLSAGLGATVSKAQLRSDARALLIGVSRYRALPALPGAGNDIDYMRSILERRLGFRSSAIEEVRDEAATREGILEAFDRLARASGPDSVVYVHYSGHGSQVPDIDGDEDDGLDESIVPFDGRTPGIRDITDDELGQRLAAIEGAVVVVLDSCHSGTATRSLVSGVRSRVVPPDDRTKLYGSAARVRSVVSVEGADHVLFTAARSGEAALDAPVDGRPHGVFTYAIGQSLVEKGSEAAPKALLQRASRELDRIRSQLGLNVMPTPQLEGEERSLDRRLFTLAPTRPVSSTPSPSPRPSDQPARLPWSRAEPMSEGVLLPDAAAIGGVPGSVWGLYRDGEREFPVAGLLATVRVQRLEGDIAHAVYLSGRRIEGPGRAIRLAAPPPPAESEIAWRSGPESARRSIEVELRKLRSSARVVRDPTFAVLGIEWDEGEGRLYGIDGATLVEVLEDATPVDVARLVHARLDRHANAKALHALANPASQMSLSIDVVGHPSASGPSSTDEGSVTDGMRAVMIVADTAPPAIRIKRPSEPRTLENSLQIEVESDRDCYLTVIDLDVSGGVSVLFPNPISEKRRFHPSGRLGGGRAIRIPDSLESGNRAGFFLDYGPPAGLDTIFAHCAESLELATTLRDRVAGGEKGAGGGQALRGTGGVGESRSLDEIPLRSFVIVADASAAGEKAADELVDTEWTTSFATIEISE